MVVRNRLNITFWYDVCLADENIFWGKGAVIAVDVKGHMQKATHLCLQQ